MRDEYLSSFDEREKLGNLRFKISDFKSFACTSEVRDEKARKEIQLSG